MIQDCDQCREFVLWVLDIQAVLTKVTVVGFEVLTAMAKKSSISWDIMPCSPLKANRRFGRKCRLHLHGRRISKARNRSELSWLEIQSYSYCRR
jgi:hypothetical protein